MKKINNGQKFKNYKALCEFLKEPVKTGKSKQLQLKDWERYFQYHKEGNAIIVDAVHDEVLKKKRKKCIDTSSYGSNNIKNIEPMIKYLMSYWNEDISCFTITQWLCEQLDLLNERSCRILYSDQATIEEYCRNNLIRNTRLFCEYVSAAKSIMGKIFCTALNYMWQKDLCEYSDGYYFTYQLGKQSMGHFFTTELNEEIMENETKICNQMNAEHGLSEKLSGRQNLLLIYGSKALVDEFNEKKVSAIMNDEYSVNICNECIDDLDANIPEGRRCYIGETYPLLSYYRSISIDSMEVIEEDSEPYARKLCNTVLQKTRKMIFSKHYRNKYTGRMIFPYDRFECMDDILSIEKILFRHIDRGTQEDPDIDLDDLFSDSPAA